jgi:hypothetical protein
MLVALHGFLAPAIIAVLCLGFVPFAKMLNTDPRKIDIPRWRVP